jgi:nucleoside diphosphate kinase
VIVTMDRQIRIATSEDYEKGIPLSSPDWLSTDHIKRYRYGQEPYYQEAINVFLQYRDHRNWLEKYTFMLLKPDAFPPRAMFKIVCELAARGFEVVDAVTPILNRLQIRELWRYEYNIATVQRYPLLDMFLGCGPSVLLVLRDRHKRGVASERLTRMKGPSDPKERPADSIRASVRAAGGTLNFMHTPDTSIDLIRELGVLLPNNELKDLLLRSGGSPALAVEALSEIEQKVLKYYPRHELTVSSIVRHYGATFGGALEQRAPMLISDTYDEVEAISKKFSLSFWDRVTLINEYLQFCVPGIKRVFEFEVEEVDHASA